MLDDNTWVVLPTYNEAENLAPIVAETMGALSSSTKRGHILIVDDGSPDGTGHIADRLAAEHPGVFVLHRTHKQGLGRAYLAGFQCALDRGADLIMEMDADFSHDPAAIPSLIRRAQSADLVLGSRYIAHGRIENWKFGRRMLSRAGALYARTVLGLAERDLTGGFKCFRREVLERLDLSSVKLDGYGFQVELTYRAVNAGFHVSEVPIVFTDRRAGKSKMNAAIAAEAVWKLLLLRLKRRSLRKVGREVPLLSPSALGPTAGVDQFPQPSVLGN